MKRFERFIVFFVIVSLMVSASAGVFAISGKEKNLSLVTFYDFVQNADKAVWQSGAGYLPFPGSASDSRGFALWQTNSYMENNKKYAKILETHPEWKENGYIMGTYPNLTVPTGAKLSLKIGFLKEATGTDGVIYRVFFNYTGQPITIFEKYKRYTEKVETETIDLSEYQGKNGKFILYVSAGGKSSAQDWAGWAEAEILYTKKYPDLVITDLWNKSGVIHYKIKNIGDAPTAPKTPISFTNSLYLNNKSISQDTITQILNPNEEIERSFGSYSYQPPQGTHTLKVCADVSQSIDESNEGNNCLTKTISPGGIKVDTGCKDTKVEIYNSSEKLVISGYSNEKHTYSTGLILAPDNYKVVPSKKNCTFTPSYKLVNVVSNQVVNVAFQCSCKRADLVITEITRLKTGGTIQYKVKNQGSTGTESYFYNALYINEEFIIKDYVKVYIKAGEELSREFSYSYTPTPPKDTVKVCADSDKNIEEENEENNCLEVTWYTEEKLPDLIIDEIKCDRENSRIGYVLKNIGEETAKGGHSITLFVDGKEVTHDLVSADLKPGMTYSSWVKEYKWPASKDIRVKICADGYNKLKESNEQNNCLEKTCKCPTDTAPPKVTITYSPSEVTTADEITFTAHATDNTGVSKILIFVNDVQVKECTPGFEKTDKEGRKYWECIYTGGPYDNGTLTYQAEAIDGYKNRGLSSEKSVEVTITITTPPLLFMPCFFSISGTIHNFWHAPRTLRVKICEAETIVLTSPDPLTGVLLPPMTQCKEGGNVWYADVTQQFMGDLPSGDMYYSLGGFCPGEYILVPVRSLIRGPAMCEWQGSWQAAKGQVVTIESSSAEGFDFTFEPLDSSAPTVSNILAEPEHPGMDEDVAVTILAEDNQGIASIWERTETVDMDGIVHPGRWRSLTISPGLEGSTAGAQFSITDDRLMQATVEVKVCDIGGNSYKKLKVILFGSCDDGIQNQGETGIDCGGPCPSQCIDCLFDWVIGTGPSAYLYSPGEISVINARANEALQEYADHLHDDYGQDVVVTDLDTSDEYIDAISWWVAKNMGYRGDSINEKCCNDVQHLDYDPDDYGHGDFPQTAYYTLEHSGCNDCNGITHTEDDEERTWHPDPSKRFYGDCEDFGILEAALLRSLGVSYRCIFSAEQPGHSFNIVYYKGRYRVLEPQANDKHCKYYGPYNLWNDKIGSFACSDFDEVRPWEYTMNYPGCEHPSVLVSGGSFGEKRLWLDWNGWGENIQPGVYDFNGDGKDDVAAVRVASDGQTKFWFTSNGNSLVKNFAESVTGDSNKEFYVTSSVTGIKIVRGTVLGATESVKRYGRVESPDSRNMVRFQRSEGNEELMGNVYVCHDWATSPKIYLLNNSLRIEVPDSTTYNHWSNVDRAPQLRYNIGPGDWSIETELRVSDYRATHHAGLMVYFEEDDIIYWGLHNGMGREHLKIERSGEGSLGERAGIWTRDKVYLKITKAGTEYSFFYKDRDSSIWTLLETVSVAETPTKVGLLLKTWQPTAITAAFDYFDFSTDYSTFHDDFNRLSIGSNWAIYRAILTKWRSDFCSGDEIPFVADFDGDGTDDIITFKRSEGNVYVALSEPEKFCFGESLLWHNNFCLGNEIPAIGDFNGDGKMDIVTFNRDTGQVFVALSTIFGFYGDGWLWTSDFCHSGDTPFIGDFNGDGRDDIAYLSVDDGRARIWVALTVPSSITYGCHGGNICGQATFYTKAYWPDICP